MLGTSAFAELKLWCTSHRGYKKGKFSKSFSFIAAKMEDWEGVCEIETVKSNSEYA